MTMCIGDWRLGRLIRSKITTANLTTGLSISIPADRNRVGVIAGMGNQQALLTGYTRLLVDGTVIFFLGNGTPSATFTLATHGELPTRAFSILSVGATTIASFVEFFMPEEYLSAGLEEYIRERDAWEKSDSQQPK